MKTSAQSSKSTRLSALAASLFFVWAGCDTLRAYQDYGGCSTCHGDFRGSTSVKGTVFSGGSNHEMHRNAAYMATACNLCHSGTSRTPVYTGSSNGTANNTGLGCTGCHVASGLRAHHVIKGVTECYDCHTPETPPAENVKPPYYGTADTKVNNPGNEVQVALTNENWSVGDFVGLDNDGNGLYDLADYAVGPFKLISVKPEGNDFRVIWLTAGGRSDVIQAASGVSAAFADVGSPVASAGVGLKTNSYLDAGAATNGQRFYRMKGLLP